MTTLAGKKILLADDQELNRMIIKKFLQKWNCVVFEANDGQQVLELLEHQDIDLILLDLEMPNMNGIETAKAIRKHYNQLVVNTPIIAITASLIIEIQQKVTEAGINDMVTKPFIPDVFQQKMINLLLH